MKKLKKKQKNLFIFGLITLLILVLGASYAYFEAETFVDFGSSSISGDTGAIGTVILNGNNTYLNLNITSMDMARKEDDVVYYASENGKMTTPTSVTVGEAIVTPNTDTNFYRCTYTLSVTHNGTNDMYDKFNQKTGNTYDYTNRSTDQVVLTINDVDYDFYDGWPTSNQVEGVLYTKVGNPAIITAGFRFANSYDIDQSYLKNTDISIGISVVNNSFNCKPYAPASQGLIAFSNTLNNSSKISKYTGSVTDECTDDTCNTVDNSKRVYIFKSNDVNNVVFENYCWRIVRTTESGGVKLLYNGIPTTVGTHKECPSSGRTTTLTQSEIGASSNKITYSHGGAADKPAYIGYMYNSNSLTSNYYDQIRADNVNRDDSLLKEKTEYWFSHSGINSNKLEDTVYCNDRSLAIDSTIKENELEASSSGELKFSSSTSLECEYITDSFNTTNTKAKTNYKVGFLTYAERSLIGKNPTYSSGGFWIGTPNSFSSNLAKVRSVSTTGGVSSINTSNTREVRPVISASFKVLLTDGSGTEADPFIFE